ncbi:hypothetical protein SAMN05192542_104138 [Paraburkholderia caballeronis]|uniref:Uncharacterized protein n=2 Tax=Paraburkholderia caballeronis TaxID=416943 RepID=A0A1H7L0W0_9BURK|nr:hypothetical protein [Paraburkholderia caballeronis]PXW28246.1 hypothetical protein C7403_102138 [Paraburkholderia caballeronis]PXX03612.1 hypothetical protein C7407_102138 [Paraburkholderia caballeronis]RAK04356.1 hypothetical protein C7409_102138 [Paraburkholderia caballeronis]SEK92622.1 hypothetical protein SAMN05192542_104138 [Paraburkholderia caballeronis]
MPGRQTVLGWLADKDNEGFRTRYAYAREAQADLYAEECIEIADTPVLGTKTVSREWGEEVTEADMIEHRRLQVLTRQWYASKLAPKKYGDKLQADLNHSGTVQVVKLNNEPAPEMPE